MIINQPLKKEINVREDITTHVIRVSCLKMKPRVIKWTQHRLSDVLQTTKKIQRYSSYKALDQILSKMLSPIEIIFKIVKNISRLNIERLNSFSRPKRIVSSLTKIFRKLLLLFFIYFQPSELDFEF